MNLKCPRIPSIQNLEYNFRDIKFPISSWVKSLMLPHIASANIRPKACQIVLHTIDKALSFQNYPVKFGMSWEDMTALWGRDLGRDNVCQMSAHLFNENTVFRDWISFLKCFKMYSIKFRELHIWISDRVGQ